MSQHEVEVKPYGTKNEVDTRVYGSSTSRSGEVDMKPPYGQRNESSSAPLGATFNVGGGSRTDVDVKPYGTQDIPRDTGVNKQVRVTTSTVRPMEQWRNPLMATLLGITLALTLLSLSYLPRAISGLWHYTTSWTPWGGHSNTHQHKSMYDTYDSSSKHYPHKESVYQQGKDLYQQGKDMYNQQMDQAGNVVHNVKDTGDSLYNRVKHTGENIIQQAKDTVYSGPSLTYEARQTACMAAQKARDTACDGIDTRSWNMDSTMQHARDTAQDASNRASGMFESAKQKASEVLEAAKQTVTYPIHAAKDTVGVVGDNIQVARDTVVHTGSNARDRVEGTARDTLQATENLAQAAKDSVLNAGQAARDTVQAAKDTVVGAGQAAANMASNAANAASNAVHNAKETITGSHSTDTTNPRGPTRVKVEVQEL